MTILNCLIDNAALYPDKEAFSELKYAGRLETQRRALTWSQFKACSDSVSRFLVDAGFSGGKKVAILMHNCLEWLPVYFGILGAGCVAVPLNFRFTAEELDYCCRLAEVSFLFYGSEFDAVMANAEVRNTLPSLRLEYRSPGASLLPERLFQNDIKAELPPLPEEDDDAAIYFSSGTTGFPKAILHRHRSLISSAMCEVAHHHQTENDRFLCIPPLYHTGAIIHWFGSLYTGGSATLLVDATPEKILWSVSDERCTIVWLLVPWAQDILTLIESGKADIREFHLDQWRLMHIGAQPVPPSLIGRWLAVFPQQEYDTNYGLTESCGPGCIHLGVENLHKVGAIGLPGCGWEAKVVDSSGKELPADERGELCVRGSALMSEYFNDPEATAHTLIDGWLHTGDIAIRDSDGFYWLVDRKKDIIIVGGENVYPIEIENYIIRHGDVRDVAVIGYPDDRLGEKICAVVELKENHSLSEEDIIRFCQPLPRYKRPDRVVFDKVPRNATGKISKKYLRQKYAKKGIGSHGDYPERAKI